MRFHEAALCAIATLLPVVAVVIWPHIWVPLAALCVSVLIIRFVGWMIEA